MRSESGTWVTPYHRSVLRTAGSATVGSLVARIVIVRHYAGEEGRPFTTLAHRQHEWIEHLYDTAISAQPRITDSMTLAQVVESYTGSHAPPNFRRNRPGSTREQTRPINVCTHEQDACRMTDQRPNNPESKTEKKERLAIEAEAAWADYHARKNAVDANTERLRALRVEREAQLAAEPAPKKKRARA
jgi:hypothetical protein